MLKDISELEIGCVYQYKDGNFEIWGFYNGITPNNFYEFKTLSSVDNRWRNQVFQLSSQAINKCLTKTKLIMNYKNRIELTDLYTINEILLIEIPADSILTDYSKDITSVIGKIVKIENNAYDGSFLGYVTLDIISSPYTNFKNPNDGRSLTGQIMFSNNPQSAGYIPNDNIKKLISNQ